LFAIQSMLQAGEGGGLDNGLLPGQMLNRQAVLPFVGGYLGHKLQTLGNQFGELAR
jgi:hypothetical protein